MSLSCLFGEAGGKNGSFISKPALEAGKQQMSCDMWSQDRLSTHQNRQEVFHPLLSTFSPTLLHKHSECDEIRLFHVPSSDDDEHLTVNASCQETSVTRDNDTESA